ncbi:acyltransferase family protein [Plesiomonas sp.]|uniref:acyltransferase family protein n=1 Tax=Plesiomonas sp. TaxID=2486279 RepID=UPI003F3E6D41
MNFKLNNFDMLRLFAAYQVALGHALEHFDLGRIPLSSYFPGVPIFFSISGFLISASWERNNSFGGYIKNRFLRIYPALWFCFLLSVSIVSLTYKFNVFSFSFFKWSLAQLTVGQFYNPDFFRSYGVGVINGSLWTIPVEIQFYLLIPIIYFTLNKVRWNNLVFISLVIALSIINHLRYSLQNEYGDILTFKLFSVTVIPYLNMFLFGVFLQRNICIVSRFLSNKFLYWLALYIVSIFITERLGMRNAGNAINPISALLLTLVVISAAYSYTGKLSNILKGNDISYGIYIYHMVFINFILSANIFSSEVSVVIAMLLTTTTAFLSWRLLEKPMLSFKSVRFRQ